MIMTIIVMSYWPNATPPPQKRGKQMFTPSFFHLVQLFAKLFIYAIITIVGVF